MIGEEIRAKVFRDTKNFYKTFPQSVVGPELVRFARHHAGRKVRDLGCATGNSCAVLAKFGYDMTGADVNKEYVEIARHRSINAVPFTKKVPFPDGTFETVIVYEVLEHFADLDHRNFFARKSLSELLRPRFRKFRVNEDEGINRLGHLGFRPIRLAGAALMGSHLWRPRFHFCLFALVEV